MTSKATLKLAEELIDHLFREAEGQADRKIDLQYLLEETRSTLDKAEPALDYLQSRGLIHPVTGDGIYLTSRGVQAMVREQDIKELPKYEKAWGAPASSPPMGLTSTPPGRVPSRPYRPMLAFTDPEGNRHTFNLEWQATVGRSDAATLKLPDPRASKQHVEIRYAGDRYILRDLGSANGTMLNGNYVDVHELQHGDVMLIGRTEVMYLAPELIPEPHGEPPADMAKPKAAPPPAAVPDLDPTTRPAHADTAPRAPRPVELRPEPPVAVIPQTATQPRQEAKTIARVEPVRVPAAAVSQTGKVQVPAAAITGTGRPPEPAPAPKKKPAASEAVPIVKGRPEAPPAAHTPPFGADPFASHPPPPGRQLPTDLFGEPPPVSQSLAAQSPPEPARGSRAQPPPAADLFEDPGAKTVLRGKQEPPRGDLFAEPAAASGPDLFAEAPKKGPDLFGGAPEPSPDLFATAPMPKGTKGKDLFAADETLKPPSRGGAPDLFAAPGPPPASLFDAPAPGTPDVFGGAQPPDAGDIFATQRQDAPDLFAAPEAPTSPPDSLFGTTEGSVSPLPLDVSPRPVEDLLPPEAATGPAEPYDESTLPFLDAQDAVMPVDQEEGEVEHTIAMAPIRRQTVPLEEEIQPAPLAELAGWEPPPPSLNDDAGGSTEEAPPVSPTRDAGIGRIEAAAFDVPEAPESLPPGANEEPMLLDEGASTSDIKPVPFNRFSETLILLRARLGDAGVPDAERLFEAIELIRKHPSVRAALTEP